MKRALAFTAPLLVLIYHFSAQAQSLSFEEVWVNIQKSSSTLESVDLKQRSSMEAVSRASKHWLPKVYFDVHSYQTNDPSAVFFGKLQQRSIETSDFSPRQLNNSGYGTFHRGALGVDLPLYEGGVKMNETKMAKLKNHALQMEAKQVELNLYLHSARAYASIAIIKIQIEKLQNQSTRLQTLIKNYRLGQKSNPIGYSGLLGMKSLANRIDAQLEQLQAKEVAFYSGLYGMGLKNRQWQPKQWTVLDFTEKYFTADSSDTSSFHAQSSMFHAKSYEKGANMEKAHSRPKVGAFAETYMFRGNRDTQDGYMAGVYLKWNLFNPANYGSYKEARLNAIAAEMASQGVARKELAERQGLAVVISALKNNLIRLNNSEQLLSEQEKVSSTLFKNGSINSLQLVEILNRRSELIEQQTEVQLQLLELSAKQLAKTPHPVPSTDNLGGI